MDACTRLDMRDSHTPRALCCDLSICSSRFVARDGSVCEDGLAAERAPFAVAEHEALAEPHCESKCWMLGLFNSLALNNVAGSYDGGVCVLDFSARQTVRSASIRNTINVNRMFCVVPMRSSMNLDMISCRWFPFFVTYAKGWFDWILYY